MFSPVRRQGRFFYLQCKYAGLSRAWRTEGCGAGAGFWTICRGLVVNARALGSMGVVVVQTQDDKCLDLDVGV